MLLWKTNLVLAARLGRRSCVRPIYDLRRGRTAVPRRRDTEGVPILAWGSGSGAGAGSAQLMIICKHSRARALSVMSGKCRRSSTTPDSSPPSWQAWRIARAVTSSTANMGGAWTGLIAGSKQAFVPPCSVQGLSQPVFMLHRSNAESPLCKHCGRTHRKCVACGTQTNSGRSRRPSLM